MVSSKQVAEIISELLEDSMLPRNIRLKLEEISNELKEVDDDNLKLKADKCIHELDEISNDANLIPCVRTQIWSIVSMLETME